MKSCFFILISLITVCLSSCDLSIYNLLVHKQCNEQTLSKDLVIMKRRMDSTDFQNLKNGLCQIKLEGGDINAYTYYKVKEFWSHNKSFRKHDIQTSTASINESIKLADQLGCENWKNDIKEHIIPVAMRPWKKTINNNDALISASIELGLTNNTIIEVFALDSFVVSNVFTFIKTEELIVNIREELNQKIDSLRAL